jgi:putative ABC transport system permease protein
MRLALRELRRRPGRFVTAAAILTLIASLLMLLGGLLDGLIFGSTSAVLAQRGEVIVYASGSEESFLRSRIAPELRAAVDDVPGVAGTSGLGVAQLGARVPGAGERDLADVALFGYERAPSGVPDPPEEASAEGYADESLRNEGVEEGMTLELGPFRTPVRVAGFVEDLEYSGQATLWVDPATWRDALNANRPGSGVGDGVFQALVVQAEDGTDPEDLAAEIDRATEGATSSSTLEAAADAIPGVDQQRSVFNQIIGVTVLIAVVVVALFFALLTVERTQMYGVLKAIGATSRTLFGGVVLQAVVVTAVAALVGTVLAVGLDLAIPAGSIPYSLSAGRVLSSVAFLLVAAVVGCAFSLRRVLRIDPASAIGS